MKLRWSEALACGLLSAGLAIGLHAQQVQTQPPTFKSGTQVVEVDVRVFDKDGHFVTTLRPEDFEIKEDGVNQPITAATLIGGEPGTLNTNTNPGTTNRTPDPPNRRTPEPQAAPAIWVFVFDTLHLSDAGLHNTRQAVESFLQDTFHDGDIGGVILDGKMVNNRLTSVREELVKAVAAVRVPDTTLRYQTTMRREWPPIQDEFEAWRIADQNDLSAIQQATNRACTMDPDMCRATSPDGAVRAKAENIMTQAHASTLLSLRIVEGLSNGLARMAGPKTVVYISEGFVVQGAEEFVRDATGMANRAGAHFYTIDARGLNKGSSSSDIIDQKLAFDSAGAFGGFDMQEDGTNALAMDTGGIPIRHENDFGRALAQIQSDASTYYVVGYTPSNQTFDGKYRKIEVSVKRTDVKVRARRGYLALEPAKLLRPVPIRTAPPGIPASVPTPPPSEPAPAPAGAVIAPTAASAPAADAIRARIENGGLVAGLPSAGTTATDDPAARGWAAYQKGDVETAARELKAASADGHARPWVHYVLGFCELALQHYSDAAASWERVRTAAPTFEPVYFNLADAYIGEGSGSHASDVLKNAAKRWPKDAEISDAEGVIQIHSGALGDAIASFERATKLGPKDPLGFFNLASAHHAAALRLREMATSRTAQLQQTPEERRLVELSGGSGFVGKALWQRNAAIQAYHRVIALTGDYVEQAKKGLAALEAK